MIYLNLLNILNNYSKSLTNNIICPISGKRCQVLLKWRSRLLFALILWFSLSFLCFRTFCQNKDYESGLVCVLQALEIYPDEELQSTAINIRKKIARRQLKAQMETGPVWSRASDNYHQCVLLLKSLLYLSFCMKKEVFIEFCDYSGIKKYIILYMLFDDKQIF